MAVGDAASKPTDPTKSGHEFAGWFSDSGLSAAFDFATKITKNTTIYAKWTAVYSIEISDTIENGTVTAKVGGVAATSAKAGDTVTLTATPEGTARLKSLKIDETENVSSVTTGTREFTFTMPAANVTVTAEFGWIGTKATPDAVGDIVFNDGSAEAYSASLALTTEQKTAAVAVIFYAGSESDMLGARTLGVGLVHQATGLDWATSVADGSKSTVGNDGTSCTPTPSGNITAANAENVTAFSGTVDGSGNWGRLAAAVSDEDTSGRYPAWDWVNSYKDKAGSQVTDTDYESDWYMPSLAELTMLLRARTDVNNSLAALGKAQFTTASNTGFWSSSQTDGYNNANSVVWFGTNGCGTTYRNATGNSWSAGWGVCAIRAF